MLRVALPNKGRLADDVRELLRDAGLEVRARGERALTASLGGVFEALFVRTQDIPEFVADGAADAGVTGWDVVNESGRELEQLLDLEFGRCRLILATKEENPLRQLDQVPQGARVATSFTRLAKTCLSERGLSVEVVPVSGATEIAPHLGIADWVVDITSTGSTLKVNGLVEVATLLESSARLVTRPNLQDEGKRRALEELTAALSSVLRARGKRYLMVNVPREKLSEVREVLPGLSGPTVVSLYGDEAKVAVHAVVAADALYRTIAKLKELGGEGILVTRIERLMP